MAFALHKMPQIKSFAEAKAFHDSAKLWRDPPRHGARKIDAENSKTNKHVRMVRDRDNREGYAFRYHDTDVVTWWTEDEFHVEPWASMSTTAFMAALLPPGFDVNMHHPAGCALGVRTTPYPEYPTSTAWGPEHEAAYAAWRVAYAAHRDAIRWHLLDENRSVKVTRDPATGLWTVDRVEPIGIPTMNHKAIRAASKAYRLADFDAWFDATRAVLDFDTSSLKDFQYRCRERAQLAGTLDPEAMGVADTSDRGLRDLASALEQPSTWWVILASSLLVSSGRYLRGGDRYHFFNEQEKRDDYVRRVKHAARMAAYFTHGAVTETQVGHVMGEHMLRSVKTRRSKWMFDYINWPIIDERKANV